MFALKLAVALLTLGSTATWAGDRAFAVSAAKKLHRSIQWQPNSVVAGDFTCRGRREIALLGTSRGLVSVAVFEVGSRRPLEVMHFEGRDVAGAELTTESLDFSLEELEKQVGYIPEGLVPSKTCLGLNMSDKLKDSAHIY